MMIQDTASAGDLGVERRAESDCSIFSTVKLQHNGAMVMTC